MLVSDKVQAWNTTVIREVARWLKLQLHMVSASAHFANGFEEAIIKRIRSLFRKLLSENWMVPSRWHELLNIVLMSPINVFVGLSRPRPLDFFRDQQSNLVSLKDSQSVREIVNELHRKLDGQTIKVHKAMVDIMINRQERRNKQKNVRDLEVKEGDYVLVRNHDPGFRSFHLNG